MDVSAIGVYPRVYGGTLSAPVISKYTNGLSPRVRGNPEGGGEVREARGSIPACTGEPVLTTPTGTASQVYPRVYGGTLGGDQCHPRVTGLSPRVRGNQGLVRDADDDVGSIPACTGEPITDTVSEYRAGVYPRVYGGTTHSHTQEMSNEGLSPRVRGNLAAAAEMANGIRSIPACTGEPAFE